MLEITGEDRGIFIIIQSFIKETGPHHSPGIGMHMGICYSIAGILEIKHFSPLFHAQSAGASYL